MIQHEAMKQQGVWYVGYMVPGTATFHAVADFGHNERPAVNEARRLNREQALRKTHTDRWLMPGQRL